MQILTRLAVVPTPDQEVGSVDDDRLVTLEELRARRAALLAEARTTLEDLRTKRDAYLLDLEGQALLSDIEDIDYLLDGD